jgi:hypothetical protein
MAELECTAGTWVRRASRCPAARRERTAVTVIAEGTLDASPEVVFGFLADLNNHRLLTDRYLRLESLMLDEPGGEIVIRGPLGVRRTARTKVTALRGPELIGGTAAVGRRTRARVEWRISPAPDGAHLELWAAVVEASIADRVLLALGGRWWLNRRMDVVVARVAAALDPAAVPAHG